MSQPIPVQHVADYYQFRDPIRYDNLMRDALGVKRLSLSALLALYNRNTR